MLFLKCALNDGHQLSPSRATENIFNNRESALPAIRARINLNVQRKYAAPIMSENPALYGT